MKIQKDYEKWIQTNYEEWNKNGKCSDAVALNEAVRKNSDIKEDYFDTANPQFFTGDLDSKLVLVHLNPKRDNNWGCKNSFSDFEAYMQHHKKFGYEHYGEKSERIHKSPFDMKQIRFLSPFEVLPFNGEKYHDLEIVLDNKLQLELIPFGSPNFEYKKVGINNIKTYMEILLDVISSKERKYIIFCGKVFSELLDKGLFQEKRKQGFSEQLVKKDETFTKINYQVINIKIKYNNKTICAAIAPQFAMQGCPIDKYGEMVKKYYGKFD